MHHPPWSEGYCLSFLFAQRNNACFRFFRCFRIHICPCFRRLFDLSGGGVQFCVSERKDLCKPKLTCSVLTNNCLASTGNFEKKNSFVKKTYFFLFFGEGQSVYAYVDSHSLKAVFRVEPSAPRLRKLAINVFSKLVVFIRRYMVSVLCTPYITKCRDKRNHM